MSKFRNRHLHTDNHPHKCPLDAFDVKIDGCALSSSPLIGGSYAAKAGIAGGSKGSYATSFVPPSDRSDAGDDCDWYCASVGVRLTLCPGSYFGAKVSRGERALPEAALASRASLALADRPPHSLACSLASAVASA